MPHSKLLGFTLVELIVVITIVGILSTIGFVSYSGYLTGARDSNRYSQMTKLSDSLQTYAASKSLPLPDDSIDITASGSTNVIAYQGYVGVDVLETIDYTNGGKDPKDDSYFTYYLTKDRKSMQLLTFMEDTVALLTPTPTSQSYAADYEDRTPKTYGKKLGVLVSAESGTINTPAQEISTNTTAGFLDIVTTTANYTAVISNEEQVTGTGTALAFIKDGASSDCSQILRKNAKASSGTYTINPDGTESFEVYCDMETDGGGWTALVRINPSLNTSYEWSLNTGVVDSNGFYNYMDIANRFDVNELYVSQSEGWDGSEYVFEKVGNDLYARRGTLKDVMLRADWAGLSANGRMNNWIGFAYTNNGNGFYHESIEYIYIGHTFIPSSGTYWDFPFHPANNTPLSDNPWGGRNFEGDVTATIFVR